ncbi:MAG: helix-turn-helix domain-containing protein [Solirubrobacteraceae bacterium]|nr:helix-turn-helix domain-containing protein [Solirubrobacteraceae bacterium]
MSDGQREEREARARIAALPAGLAAVLRAELPSVADEAITAIRDEVDEYHRPFGGAFGRTVRQGVELALGEFVALIEDPDRPAADSTGVMVELGRGEVRSGRALHALQAAYRCGARVSWRRFAEVAGREGADAETLVLLGEAIFAYVHRLSALSVQGYAQEQALRAGATQRDRDRLVRLAVADPPRDPADVDAAARQLGWTIPGHVAVVLAPEEDGPAGLLRTDPEVVAAIHDGAVVALVPAPAVLERILGGAAPTGLVVGPVGPWTSAPRAHRVARTLLRLRDEGRLGEDGPGTVRAEDHLVALVVHADPAVADDLADATLAPLDALPEGRRARHLETLRAWLDHRGHGPRMAEDLHLHAQTVRYRVARLREVLGPLLDGPDGRFRLELALRRRGLR